MLYTAFETDKILYSPVVRHTDEWQGEYGNFY